MPIVRDNATALYRQIAVRLREDIARGRFDPSGRLPSEAEIGTQFGVSRVTVRLALDALTRDGLIERRKGKGSYVAGKEVRHELDTLRSFHETLLLQGLKATMRIVGLDLVKTPEPVAGLLGPGWETCLRLDRLHFVDDESIALGRTFLPAALATLPREDIENQPAYAVVSAFFGQDVEHAQISIGAQAPGADIEVQLGLAEGTALLVMERTSWFAGNVPAEHSTFHIRPERYRFVMNSYFQSNKNR
jgi:GntR family transcriptional regulator